MRKTVIAILISLAMVAVAIAARIDTVPLVPGGVRGSDKVPMGRPGTTTDYTASMDQIKGYTLTNYTGARGPAGPAATVAVGTVTTLPAGSSATVTNTGTTSAAVFNFAIPRGNDGTGVGDMTKLIYDPTSINASPFARANHTGTQSADTITDGTTNKAYTAAEKTKLAAISGTNTGDETGATIKSKLGAATNSVDGYLTAVDRAAFAAKQNALTAGVDYLAPTGSAAGLTSFPTLNQNTTGTAAGLTAAYIDWTAGSGGASIKNKPTLGTAAAKDIPATGNASATQVVYGTDTRLTDARNPLVHNQDASTITTGTMDGDRLPAMSTAKKGAVPATGTPAGKFLKDDGTWATVVTSSTTTKAASFPSTDDTNGVTAAYTDIAIDDALGELTYFTDDPIEKGKLAWWDATTGELDAYTLPTCTGTDKITSNGSTLSCAADQTGTAGTGITTLNALTATSQSFANGTNIAVTSAGSTHTIGITGTIADANIASAATWNAKPSLTSTAPNMDGVASAGSGTSAARVDHVHPTDISRQTASTELTGLAGLVANGYVKRTGVGTYTVDNSTFLTSASTLDATKISGAIPGTVTATTQTAGDNSTKLATTAYVATAVSAAGGGNVSNSGTPTIHQFGVWTGANNIKGVSVTASKVMCTDVNGEPVACTNLTDSASSGGITTLTGDVTASGTGSVAATVARIQGVNVDTAAPNDGDVWQYSTSSAKWLHVTTGTLRSTLSIGNVENTALSTWAGSANITTIGTISSGTVPVGRIGSLGTGVGTALGNALGGAGGVTTTIASGTTTLGTSAIASGACAAAATTAATNVATTDVINWGFNSDPTGVTGYAPTANGMLTIVAYPTAGNVNYKVCNLTANSITPSSVTLNWRVWR